MDKHPSIQLPAALLTIMVLAVALRLGAALYLGESLRGAQQVRVEDQVSYDLLAQSLLAGRGYSFDQDWYPFTPAHVPTAHWSFLYPLYLAGVYAVTGYHPLAARLIQAAFSGALATWLLYRLGRQLFDQKTGLVAAGLGTVYAYLVFYDAALMTESFFILGILAMLNLALSIAGSQVEHSVPGRPSLRFPPSYWRWILLGIVCGIAALLRQTILLWLPFLFGWLAWDSQQWRDLRWWRGPVLALVLTGTLILPWTIRNYIAYHAFLPLNSNAGYAIYSANHPYHGTHFDQDYVAPLPPDLAVQDLNEAQWNTALIARAVRFIADDPRRYALLSLSRVAIFFNFGFSVESSLASNLMRVLSYGLYLPFYLGGLLMSLRRWRRYALFYLFALVYTLMHVLTWSSVRYRLPIDMALMPFAALPLQEFLRRVYTLIHLRLVGVRTVR